MSSLSETSKEVVKGRPAKEPSCNDFCRVCRIIHHILPTNTTLFRDSLKEHDKCHLCGERQTLNHLCVTCSKVQLFWSLFGNWWNSRNGDTINLHENDIIYGMTDNFTRPLGLNLRMIIAKYYLHTASRKEEE